MKLYWQQEANPIWDADKARIIGATPATLFPSLRSLERGAALANQWGHVLMDGAIVAYGWMDVTWGEAEVLLAVDTAACRQGIGTFILDRLDEAASSAGVRYLTNVVPPSHPDPEGLTSWLVRRGFSVVGEGGILRRPVRVRRASTG